MNEWMEVFKVGEHTDSAGKKHKYSESDLQEIATKYNEQSEHEAPIVIGHPSSNHPAYGWIEKLKVESGVLLAKPKQVVQEFSDAVNQGLFKKRSISLYPDNLLKHVGFLGAVPPAVKGLADVKFNEKDSAVTYEEEIEVTLTPEQEIAELKKKLADIETEKNKLQQFAEDAAILKAELSNTITTRAQIEETLSKLQLKFRKIEFEQYLLERVQYGSLTPAVQELCLELFDTLNAVNFSEKTNEESNSSILVGVKKIIEALPVAVPTGDPKELTKEYQEQNQPRVSDLIVKASEQ